MTRGLSIRVVAKTAVLFGLVGCAAVQLDPFGRPYDPANLMPPGPLKSCKAEQPMDTPPRLDFGSRPIYPVHADLLGRDGSARVGFRVLEGGSVVVDSYTSEQSQWFANHAAIAMRDWKVSPAVSKGKPVAVRCNIAFAFISRR
jgi:hypothetical protein